MPLGKMAPKIVLSTLPQTFISVRLVFQHNGPQPKNLMYAEISMLRDSDCRLYNNVERVSYCAGYLSVSYNLIMLTYVT